jgi:hypothetical protein
MPINVLQAGQLGILSTRINFSGNPKNRNLTALTAPQEVHRLE